MIPDECIICGKVEPHKRWYGVKAADKNEDGTYAIKGEMQRAHEECIRREGELEGSIFDGKH